MSHFLIVCLGGAAGSGARYLLASWVTRAVGPGFPWGTWLVNVLGCFALELVVSLIARGVGFSQAVRLLITTGFMGGFTTYSSFNTETSALYRGGNVGVAAAYLGATVFGCLLAGLLGAQLGRVLAASAP